MKIYSPAAVAAFEAGRAVAHGAVYIACAPEPVAVWSGYSDLALDGAIFTGIGARALAQVSGGALGGAEQNVTLSVSGLEPAVLELFDAGLLKDAPTLVYRLIWDSAALTLVDAQVFTRGRMDQVSVEKTPGGEATIKLLVEGAARGQGRAGARTRSDADQRMIDANDAGMSGVSWAGQKTLYTGGKPPMTAAQAVTADPAAAIQQTLDNIWN